MSDSAPCMWMRGGTSKGGYFLADDLPADTAKRDAFLLNIMGSPDIRQIDGMGGADPLTSKVAVVRKSAREGVDVDYLFLQVMVERALVSDTQNCGNILAGVGPFAIERGVVAATGNATPVVIFMENTGQIAVATVATPQGAVTYQGNTAIDGVPRPAAQVPITFRDTAGATCGSLLPSGNEADTVNGIAVTMLDNGMPCVVMRAADLGISGSETPAELDANQTLRARLEALRLACGPLMNLGDVRDKTVPKMTMVSAPQRGGTIATRTFIPHRCHKSIGVLGAVSVASACLLRGSPAFALAKPESGSLRNLAIEHPCGEMTVRAMLNASGTVTETAILRSARKLMDGIVYAD